MDSRLDASSLGPRHTGGDERADVADNATGDGIANRGVAGGPGNANGDGISDELGCNGPTHVVVSDLQYSHEMDADGCEDCRQGELHGDPSFDRVVPEDGDRNSNGVQDSGAGDSHGDENSTESGDENSHEGNDAGNSESGKSNGAEGSGDGNSIWVKESGDGNSSGSQESNHRTSSGAQESGDGNSNVAYDTEDDNSNGAMDSEDDNSNGAMDSEDDNSNGVDDLQDDSSEAEDSEDDNSNRAEDCEDDNSNEAEDSEEDNSNEAEGSEDGNPSDAEDLLLGIFSTSEDFSDENSSEPEESEDKDDTSPHVYARLANPEDQLGHVELVSIFPGEILHNGDPDSDYRMIHNCYYDLTKPYKDVDTGYYDLHFEVFYDSGGSFFNQLDTNYIVSVSSVLFDGKRPNLCWARGLPAQLDYPVGLSGESDQNISLKETIWNCLPEEILLMVLMRLPPAAQSRFRCVCSKWKTVLSSRMALLDSSLMDGRRSFCSVKSNERASHVSAYCHKERKWFDLPRCVAIKTDTHSDRSPSEIVFKWELADVEGELFCYKSGEGEEGFSATRVWVAVCNPMIPKSSLLLPPTDEIVGMVQHMKLLVDRQARAFKVLMVVTFGQMAIFDSVTFEWANIHRIPTANLIPEVQVFLLNGVVYAAEGETFPQLFVLDIVSRVWSKVDADLPCEIGRKFVIVSSKDQVMVVQVKRKGKEYIHVWKLLTDIPDDVPLFSAASWEKQDIPLPRALKTLALHFRGCTLHGSEYLFFNGGRTNQWIKYDFSRRTWCVMPFRGRRIAHLLWCDWEPGFDMDFSAIRRQQL